MKNKDFSISVKTVWVLVIGNAILTILGVLAKIQHWEFSPYMLSVASVFFFSTWVIVISDMSKNKLYNKRFWIFSMFIFPTLSPLLYLIQRNRLVRLGAIYGK